MFPLLKNVGDMSMTINYRPDSLLSVVSQAFEKLVNNLEKCSFQVRYLALFRISQ